VAVAINPELGRWDIVTPGHVFPLMARDGGTLIRAGHTEAAVDIARLAGLIPAGVICEIMNDNGTMARLPDLITFAQRHNLKLGTIADLIGHRRRTEKLVRRVEEAFLPSKIGEPWQLIAYENLVDHIEHIVLIKGDLSSPEPIMVRMHAVDTMDDVVGGQHLASLQGATEVIRDSGRGVIVLIRESRPTAISERIRAMIQGGPKAPLRDYGIGAQILNDLGVKHMILLSNHKRSIIGLEAYGLKIIEQREIKGPAPTIV
jgi:3,4-dihydroxy 2-butanone 4-phosphate synthase/GTP cyclohydrolase II